MMRSTLGAPLGGTTRGGQYGVEFWAVSLITPSNFIGGGGICFPSIVTVAPGEPGVPLICCAGVDRATNIIAVAVSDAARLSMFRFVFMGLVICVSSGSRSCGSGAFRGCGFSLISAHGEAPRSYGKNEVEAERWSINLLLNIGIGT